MHPKKKSFAEIRAEALAEPRPVLDVQPGAFNAAGDFFDPSGNLLSRVGKMTPTVAREAVAEGAALAFEGCGCGGWTGCQPMWIEPGEREALAAGTPRFVKGHGSPTWIDLWRNDAGQVVFAHGDVRWGDALL